MKSLKWRLSERPSVDNITDLVDAGIISKEEARQIILDTVEVDPITLEDLQSEVKLLRKLVLEIAERHPQTIVKIIEKEVKKQDWWTPNWTISTSQPKWFNDYTTLYCSATGSTAGDSGTSLTATSYTA